MSVTIKDNTTVILAVYINGEQLKNTDGTNYEFTVARVSDEISSDNAVMNVQLTEYVSELILIKG